MPIQAKQVISKFDNRTASQVLTVRSLKPKNVLFLISIIRFFVKERLSILPRADGVLININAGIKNTRVLICGL